MGEFPQGAAGQASPDHQRQQLDPNTSMKTEYMSFPPPLQRSPLNAATEREYVHHLCVKLLFISVRPNSVNLSYFTVIRFRPTSWLKTSYINKAEQPQESPSSSPAFTPQRSQPQQFDRGSQESLSSMPDPADPTTVTKTYKTGRKASAQANLASRSKTPSKSRRRRNKGQNRSSEGSGVKSLSVAAGKTNLMLDFDVSLFL